MKLDFDLSSYLKKIKKSSSYFHTFINRDSLAVGLLVLQSGEEDTQIPHVNDEIYFVISGNGFLRIRNKDYRVSKDKLFFVAKNIEHHFHSNTKELKVLYFFGGPDN
ncbi:MAG TPA: cupin domain-containing protein [Nitrosopumilus sp.]|nr:cupin domain-containing protein [Nitrosopumilus sp.]